MRFQGVYSNCMNDPGKSSRFQKDLELIKYFENRKTRAQARLQQKSGQSLYFALVGFNTEVDSFSINSLARLEPVVEPPGAVELASATDACVPFAAVGRWSSAIKHEIVIDRESISDEQKVLNLAWAIISSLRVRTLVPFVVPAYADRSWSTISAFNDRSVRVRLLEDYPLAKAVGERATVRAEDVQWIRDHFPAFVELNRIESFKLSVEALSTYHYAFSLRLMAVSLWAGIDALLGADAETSFRTALYAASLLEPRGASRESLFDSMRKLYKTRNKAVHGHNVADGELAQHIVAVRQILSRILCRIVEIGHVPSKKEIDELALL